jgi:hypothetical protein
MEERRGATRRCNISVAAAVWRQSKGIESASVHAKSCDVSTRGLYFTSNQRLGAGTRVGLSLTIPLQATGVSLVAVNAKAKVVRVEFGKYGRARRHGHRDRQLQCRPTEICSIVRLGWWLEVCISNS